MHGRLDKQDVNSDARSGEETRRPGAVTAPVWRDEAQPRRPYWLISFDYAAEILVRLIAASVAIGFFFGLPIMALYGHELPCTNRYLLYVPFVLGTAFSSYYFGSRMTLGGQTQVSPTTTVQIAAVGGAAFAILAAWVGYQIFLPRSCEPPKSYVHVLGLPRTIVDETQYDILHKHWPLAYGERFTVAYGYEVEVAREQIIPLIMKITRAPADGGATSFSCVLNVKIIMDDLNKGPDVLDRLRRNSVYEVTFDQGVDAAIATGAGASVRDDCFVSQEDGQPVKSIEIHPNGARFLATQVRTAAS